MAMQGFTCTCTGTCTCTCMYHLYVHNALLCRDVGKYSNSEMYERRVIILLVMPIYNTYLPVIIIGVHEMHGRIKLANNYLVGS